MITTVINSTIVWYYLHRSQFSIRFLKVTSIKSLYSEHFETDRALNGEKSCTYTMYSVQMTLSLIVKIDFYKGEKWILQK